MPSAVVIDEVYYYLIYIAWFTQYMHDPKFQSFHRHHANQEY